MLGINFKNILQSQRNQTQKVHTVWSHLYQVLEQSQWIHSIRKHVSGCLGPRVEVGNWLQRSEREFSEMIEMFPILTVVVSWKHVPVKTYQTVHLMRKYTSINFIFKVCLVHASKLFSKPPQYSQGCLDRSLWKTFVFLLPGWLMRHTEKVSGK